MIRSGKWKVESGKQRRGRASHGFLVSRVSLLTFHFKLSSGFSLLELIAAMTILVVVIGILGRIVTDTQRVWRLGADRARLATSVRSAFAMLEEDLSAAVADTNLTFHAEQMDSIDFFRIVANHASTNRAIRQVAYFVESNVLVRATRDLTFDEALEAQAISPESSDALRYSTNLVNLVSLDFLPHWDQPDPSDPSDPPDQDDTLLPAWLDVEVTILPERIARRSPPPDNPQDFAERYHQRFHLRNREGGRLP